MNIAIITGASSGLGKVYFEKVMERYPALDEVWLIARREDKLKELAGKYPNKTVRVLPLDLSDTKSFEILDSALKESTPNIKVLINNAGFDKAGIFREMKPADILSIVNLNVMGMTMISRCCLPHMNRGSYEIIVGSVGAYVPLPWRAVYGAGKTYGRFFARALRQEERERGVNVLFMGTGAMDTEMFRENTLAEKHSSAHFLDLDKITVTAMKRAEKGAGVYSPGFSTKAVRVFGKIVPSALAVKFTSVEHSTRKSQ